MKVEYMKEAIKEAEKAYKVDEVPIGAVIVKNNKIIARGYNKAVACEGNICSDEVKEIMDKFFKNKR